jgi:hypothetical protein
MVIGLHVKCMLFLSAFNLNWNVLKDLVKTPNMKFSENSSWGSLFFHANGRKDKYYETNSDYSLCETA